MGRPPATSRLVLAVPSRRYRSTARCLLAVTLFGAIALSGATAQAAEPNLLEQFWLREIARRWIVDEAPAKADAIIVLANGTDRAKTAARLYREGYAPLVLLSDARASEADPSTVNRWTSVLFHDGVPRRAIGTLPGFAQRTLDEAANLRRWSAAHHPRTVIIVTDAWHTRRSQWLFTSALKGTNVELITVAAPPSAYQLDSWWTNTGAKRFFYSEILKYAYYRMVAPMCGNDLGERSLCLLLSHLV